MTLTATWVLSLVALLFTATTAQTSSGLLLNTSMCEGLFDFEVNSTLLAQTEANILSLDGTVSLVVGFYPTWLVQECTYSLRKIDCMTFYASSLGFDYCASDCDVALSACSEFLGVLYHSNPAGYTAFSSKCAAFTDASGCESGGSMTSLSSDETVCPLPLVEDVVELPIESYQRYTHIPGSDCATPCAPVPTPYKESNWDSFRIAQIVVCSLSAVSSFAVFWIHFKRKAGLNNLIPAYALSYVPAVSTMSLLCFNHACLVTCRPSSSLAALLATGTVICSAETTRSSSIPSVLCPSSWLPSLCSDTCQRAAGRCAL